MIKSMTGFGRHEMVTDECKISVEIKAVNHRYLDLGIKMPKKFNYFEASMRTLLKDHIQRGKVDIFVTYEDYTDESSPEEQRTLHKLRADIKVGTMPFTLTVVTVESDDGAAVYDFAFELKN